MLKYVNKEKFEEVAKNQKKINGLPTGRAEHKVNGEMIPGIWQMIDNNLDYLNHIWLDPTIFDEEAQAKFAELPDAERVNFIMELLEQFYRNNIEYANFTKVQIYKDPIILLDYFRAIKKSHFKKCGVPLSSNEYKDRYKRLQELIIDAEKAIAKTPIDVDKLATVWPILRIRNLFSESELAAFYYLQNPRTENAIIENGDYNIPFGPHLFLADYVIAHAAAQRNFRYDLTASGKKKSDRNKALTVKPVKNGFEVTEKKKGSVNNITIINKDLIQSTSAMKLFVFLLAKANQQNFNPTIHFQLQELVNIGMYSSIISARTGFKNHILAVQSLQMAGEFKKGKRNVKAGGGVLFYNHSIDQNGVTVWVNENFNIEYLASYYTVLPAWAWGLNNSAFEILLYIFMKSRTERTDKFNLSFSIIRERLALPTKEEYIEKGKKWKPAQYVKQPIIDAIENIIAAIEINQDKNIKLDPHYIINDQDLDEWLKGYLTITISGEYSEKIKEIQKKQVKIIEANTERKEAARAMVEAQKEAEKDKNEK